MCDECGCGLPGEKPVGVSAHHHDHDHEHEHGPGDHHGHDHPHPHTHPHAHPHSHQEPEHEHVHVHAADNEPHRTIDVRRAILEKNDRLAERNRGFFRARGLLVLNFLSSPGSGKTTFIRESVRKLAPELKAGIIVGDLATDNDAQRLRESGAPVVQITTGTVCHLEAEMVGRALQRLDLAGLNLLIIENVGNLVCPASYDLGEDLRIVLLSVTEGEDKPLKYPPMFQDIRNLRQDRARSGYVARVPAPAAASAESARSPEPVACPNLLALAGMSKHKGTHVYALSFISNPRTPVWPNRRAEHHLGG
ncbi:MAG: hydrogenase nickel incorporation protein HypB [Verrucomicrobia bacterium]|nr:hydrogenase nickel incorporation protein HypB [Verrucomicrobiota bacterium]